MAKGFKTNSALDAFLGGNNEQTVNNEVKVVADPEQQAPTIAPAKDIPPAPEGYKINPVYVEVRKRRVQLLMQNSIYEAMKANCTEKGISVNEYIHILIKQDLGV